MKNSFYYRPSATVGIRTADFPHSMTMSKKVARSSRQAIEAVLKRNESDNTIYNNIATPFSVYGSS